MKNIQAIAEALNGRLQVDGRYMCHCPAHDDRTPSLSLSQNGSDKILFHCHAGCSQDDVLANLVGMNLWPGDDNLIMSDEDKTRLLDQAEKHLADREEKVEQAALVAKKVWQATMPASPDHPYLSRKQVSPISEIRQIDLIKLESLIGYRPKANGEEFTGEEILVVPVTIAKELRTLEFIDGDGRKSALVGGKKKGGYWTTDPLPSDIKEPATLLIGEGVATVLSCSQVCGYPGFAALSSGNLTSVARQIRECYPSTNLIILADLEKTSNGPDRNAVLAAEAAHASLAVPNFDNKRPEWATDFNDLCVLQGAEAVQKSISALIQAPETVSDAVPDDEAVIAQLAAMSQLEYDRERHRVAEQLKVRLESLDKSVAERRKIEDNNLLAFDEIVPWEGDLDPEQLLFDITEVVKKFVICSDETANEVALWITMTWFIDVVKVAPLAIITAPEKRCGKSVLLSLIGKLACRPLSASNITAAAVFRIIDKYCPTLILDEADTWMKQNEDLRGVINSGHMRDGAFVFRVVGDNHDLKQFNTWGAKALAGISAKNLAATLTDRAILLELRRKLPGETVERLRHSEPEVFMTLKAKLARFAEDFRETIRSAKPDLPYELNDRAQDNWEPLLAIADASGGAWPELARKTALAVSREEESARSIGVELLTDIQEIFNERKADKIRTTELIEDLCKDEERPWATYNRGFPIKPRQISTRLSEFDIKSTTIRVDSTTTAKGYLLEHFKDAFIRYLSPSDTSNPSVTASHGQNHCKKTVTSGVTDPELSVTADHVSSPESERVSRLF